MSHLKTRRPAPPQPPTELVSFVERHIRDVGVYRGAERRSDRRCLMVVPVTAQPLDDQLSAVGRPFVAVTRDISPTGIGLVHSAPIDETLLALQMFLADEEVNLVVEVVWCRALGPFYYFGGDFVAKL